MPKFSILHKNNKERPSFVSIINFLVSYKIMTLDAAACLHHKYKEGETIVLDIQDELTATKFTDYLDSDSWNYNRE